MDDDSDEDNSSEAATSEGNSAYEGLIEVDEKTSAQIQAAKLAGQPVVVDKQQLAINAANGISRKEKQKKASSPRKNTSDNDYEVTSEENLEEDEEEFEEDDVDERSSDGWI